MLWNNDPNVMLVAGHRGARHTQPENTVTAFRYAMGLNVDMIETDIRQTRDGQLILMHDATVDRTTDHTGAVRQFTLKELRAMNAAAHVEGFSSEPPALLEELLEMTAAHPTMTLNLELKDYPQVEGEDWAYETADKTIEMVERYGLGGRIILNSFSGKLLKHITEKYDHRYPIHGFYPYFYLKAEAGNPDSYLDVACVFHARQEESGKIVPLEGQIAPKEWFDYLLGKHIEPWVGAGVKTYEDLEKAVQLGARLVTTDYPAETLDMLRRMGHHQ